MPTRTPSTQQRNGFHSRIGYLSSPPPSILYTPPRGVQLEGDDALAHNIHSHGQSESFPLNIDHSLTIDLGTLVDLAGRLRPSLPPSCRWLRQEDLEVVGTRPVSAGGLADIWIGEVGNRKVAVKSYRCYASTSCMSTYKRFYREALAYTRLSVQRIVPFIGVYSTREHPFALVFEFMAYFDLGEYLRNNCDVEKLELLLGVARTLKDIHSLDIVHGNLKITNILIDTGGRAYIAGLGAASIPPVVLGADIDRFFHGAAPELIDPQRFGFVGTESTKASDIYAFGVIVWEVFAGRAPFSDKNKVAGVYSMLKGRRPGRPVHPELSDRLWKLIKGCWKVDPAQRKTIIEVVAVLEAELDKRR